VPAAGNARPWKQVALFLTVAVLVSLVALGGNRAATNDILVHRSLNGQVALVLLVVLGAVFGILAIAAVMYVVLGRVPFYGDRPVRRDTLPWWVKVATLVFVAAYAGGYIAALVLTRGHSPDELQMPVGPLLPIETGPATGTTPVVVQWWVLAAAAAAALVAFALAVLIWHRRRDRGDDEPLIERRELRTAVETSLEDLGHTADPRRAVIRAYATMERVLAKHGLARRQSEAPFEYLSRWTAALGVGHATAGTLTTLYEWAKFSPHTVDEEMRRQATEALLALRRELQDEAR
jgi:hypothetical protein